jgi:hypothetical protein
MRSYVVVIFDNDDHEITEIGEHQANYDEMRLLFARASILGLLAGHND